MPWWRWRRRVPGVLFVVCLVLAAGLAGFVAVAPSLDGGGPSEEAAGKAVALFSRDIVVRRTSLGASVGLVATAFVFFRPPFSRPPRAPTDVIGA
ncbi:MAG TPA: hypothetical protein VH120_17220 [Gemmataceae bacterium]|jgi:hypothetical protein|nr:hypothetical protein [Gemmataceae bacterium]